MDWFGLQGVSNKKEKERKKWKEKSQNGTSSLQIPTLCFKNFFLEKWNGERVEHETTLGQLDRHCGAGKDAEMSNKTKWMGCLDVWVLKHW